MDLKNKVPTSLDQRSTRGGRAATAADNSQFGGRHEVLPMVHIVARRIPWPDLKTRPDRSGLRLRWDALNEAGELLLSATEYPLADGAHVLAERGSTPRRQ